MNHYCYRLLFVWISCNVLQAFVFCLVVVHRTTSIFITGRKRAFTRVSYQSTSNFWPKNCCNSSYSPNLKFPILQACHLPNKLKNLTGLPVMSVFSSPSMVIWYIENILKISGFFKWLSILDQTGKIRADNSPIFQEIMLTSTTKIFQFGWIIHTGNVQSIQIMCWRILSQFHWSNTYVTAFSVHGPGTWVFLTYLNC